MKTQSIRSLKAFCQSSHLNSFLIRAVVRQFGGWESFCHAAPDVAAHGIDGGYSGFILNSDTESFAKRNRALIHQLASSQAEDLGTSVVEMIQGFGCFRYGPQPTDEEIGMALYAGKQSDNAVNVLNAMAWYAGEEVCRSFADLAEAKSLP